MIQNGDEASFLSCILLDTDIMFKTALNESHFFSPENRRVFRSMKVCADKNIKIDYISVGDVDIEIDQRYLVAISDRVPSAANWEYYQGRIIKTYQRERLRKLGLLISELSKTAAPGEIIEKTEQELLEICTNGQTRSVTRMADIMSDTFTQIQAREKAGGTLPGIATGLPGLDIMLGGFQDGRYIIIGARPSEGKSALALNMACNIALADKIPCGIISAESSNYELAMRTLSSQGKINGTNLMMGLLSRADHTNLMIVGQKIKDAPLYLYDTPNITFSEMKSAARQMVLVHGVRIIFIDYVQIVQWEDKKMPFHEQVKNVSLGIKELARELKVPIVALAQLRRDAEGREPEMADLGDSSQLEKDSDALMFIYHRIPKKKDGEEQQPEKSFLLVKKNRDGARGNIDVMFMREYVTFKEVIEQHR